MPPPRDSGASTAQGAEAAVPQVLRALWRKTLGDHTLMVAAGLSYYALFGLLPALAAAAIWGWFGDLGALKQALPSNGDLLPKPAVALLDEFITSVPTGFGAGVALLFNLLLVILTAYQAASGLLATLHIVYEVREGRNPLRRALVALGIGVSGIVILFLVLAGLALLPLMRQSGSGAPFIWLRWPVMVAVLVASFHLLFRHAPNRAKAQAGPLAWGTLVATTLCILSAAGVTFYVRHLGHFGRLYGSLGSIAILLVWLYATSLSLLVGAQVDAVLTARCNGEHLDGKAAGR